MRPIYFSNQLLKMLVMNSMLNNRFLDKISAWGGYEPLGYRWVLQKLNYHFKWWILVNLKYNLNFLDEWLKLDNQLHCLTSKAINQSYIKKRQILQTIEYRYTFYKKLGYEGIYGKLSCHSAVPNIAWEFLMQLSLVKAT